MSVVDSLPTRPLSDATVSKLNRSEPVTLAVAVDTDGDATENTGDDTDADDTDGDSNDTDGGSNDTDADNTDGETRGLLVATDDWVRGLAFDDGWRVVRAVEYDAGDDGEGRYEALRECETAVRETL